MSSDLLSRWRSSSSLLKNNLKSSDKETIPNENSFSKNNDSKDEPDSKLKKEKELEDTPKTSKKSAMSSAPSASAMGT